MSHAISPRPGDRTPPVQKQPRFQRGDLVVLTTGQPLVCVVREEPSQGFIRLSDASYPEAYLLAKLPEVKPLSQWLLPGRKPSCTSSRPRTASFLPQDRDR